MKKTFFIIFLIITALLISCAGAPKSQEAEPVTETYNEAVVPVQTPEPPKPEIAVDEDESPDLAVSPPEAEEEIPVEAEKVAEAEAPVPDEPVVTEPELAEAETEEAPVEEPVVIAEAEPEEIPKVEAVPEPEVAEAPVIAELIVPPPIEIVTPPPPPVVPAPSPAPPPPEPAPPAVLPPPPAPPPTPPPAEEAVVVTEAPRNVPELPSPTPNVRGRQDETVNYSRIVRATVGQLVEIPFRGTGWVYLGEAASRRGIVYDSRRLDLEGQSFIFRADLAGVYTLRFYRQDFIRDFIFNDHVQVIIGEAAETAGTGWFNPAVDRGRVVAEPRWPSSLEEAQALRGNDLPAPAPGASAVTPPTEVAAIPETRQIPVPPTITDPVVPPSQPSSAVQPSVVQPAVTPTPPAQRGSDESVTPVRPPVAETVAPPSRDSVPSPEITQSSVDEYLKKAKEEFDAGRVASAISLLDQLRDQYFSGTTAFQTISPDELYWLYGQFYEANSPSRNILLSLDYYRRLVLEYPQSSRCNDAQRRISYLERYYINNR
jgi:hypothetical protein